MSSAAAAKAMGGMRASHTRQQRATRTREAALPRSGPHFGSVAPSMIGMLRPPPLVTILHRDPVRVAMIECMDRDRVIAAIAAHLFVARDDLSIAQRYACGGKADQRRLRKRACA